MKKDYHDIPMWLRWPDKASPPDPTLLNESRKEMYEALALFHNHVKYVIYIMGSMPAFILLIMRLWPSTNPSSLPLYLIASVILLGVVGVGLVSIQVIKRYYEVYVSALVFATRVHIAVGCEGVHPWLERTIEQATTEFDVSNSIEFLEARAKSPKDSFNLYKKIIIILCAISFLCAVFFVLLLLGIG